MATVDKSVRLTFVTQPPDIVRLECAFGVLVLVMIETTPRAPTDVTALIAAVTLVQDGEDGRREAMDSGCLSSPQLVDSVHRVPSRIASGLFTCQPQNVVLGYAAFPALQIRHAGTYRMRVTVMEVDGTGATCLSTVDSNRVVVSNVLPTVEQPQSQQHQKVAC